MKKSVFLPVKKDFSVVFSCGTPELQTGALSVTLSKEHHPVTEMRLHLAEVPQVEKSRPGTEMSLK